MSIETATSLLRLAGIVRNSVITAKEGGQSPIYVEVKALFGSPEHLAVLADGLWDLIDKNATVIAAIGYGGIPLATAIALRHRLNLTLIRDRPKPHGKRTIFEGYFPREGDRVAIVDDKAITGATIRAAAESVAGTNAQVCGLYVVVDTCPRRTEPLIEHLITLNELAS